MHNMFYSDSVHGEVRDIIALKSIFYIFSLAGRT